MAAPVGLASLLTELTGALAPAPGSTAADLARVRRLLAAALARGQSEPVGAGLAMVPLAATPSGESLPSDVLEAVHAETDAMTKDPGSRPAARLFRRELPFITSQIPGSIPPWAAGLARTETFGPFVDELGRPVWFDVIQPIRLIQLVRAPGGPPVAALPLRSPLVGRTRYKIPAGSLWLNSPLLAAAAPPWGLQRGPH